MGTQTGQVEAQGCGESKAVSWKSINSLDDVKPGDLMLTNINGFPESLIVKGGQLFLKQSFRVGELSVDHVGIVTRAQERVQDTHNNINFLHYPRLVQAMPSGAEEISLRADKHWSNKHVYIRLPEDYPGQAADAAAIAKLFVEQNIKYSFGSYLALAAWERGYKAESLERWIDRRRAPIGFTSRDGRKQLLQLPCEAICSVLADQAWSLAGKRVMEGVKRQCVTPGGLATQLWRRESVIWGGKGLIY
jgi:hypothetical protein